MDFLEDQPDFMNLEDDMGSDTYTATFHECGEQFILEGEEDPSDCPNCDIKFIQGSEA